MSAARPRRPPSGRGNAVSARLASFYALEAQRFSDVVLPCHVASFGLGPSHTAVSSAIRLLTVAYAGRAGKAAGQRGAVLASIHEELDDTE